MSTAGTHTLLCRVIAGADSIHSSSFQAHAFSATLRLQARHLCAYHPAATAVSVVNEGGDDSSNQDLTQNRPVPCQFSKTKRVLVLFSPFLVENFKRLLMMHHLLRVLVLCIAALL